MSLVLVVAVKSIKIATVQIIKFSDRDPLTQMWRGLSMNEVDYMDLVEVKQELSLISKRLNDFRGSL